MGGDKSDGEGEEEEEDEADHVGRNLEEVRSVNVVYHISFLAL